jgi:hypothetical protein
VSGIVPESMVDDRQPDLAFDDMGGRDEIELPGGPTDRLQLPVTAVVAAGPGEDARGVVARLAGSEVKLETALRSLHFLDPLL